jgi:hypothetical protein
VAGHDRRSLGRSSREGDAGAAHGEAPTRFAVPRRLYKHNAYVNAEGNPTPTAAQQQQQQQGTRDWTKEEMMA